MHSADYYNGRIYVFRGGDGSFYLNDLHSLDIQTNVWHRETLSGSVPTIRANHASAILDGYLYIYGGWDGQQRFNDLYEINLKSFQSRRIESNQLTLSSPARSPAPRAGGKLVCYNQKLFLVNGSGENENDFSLEIWVFDLIKSNWYRVRVFETIQTVIAIKDEGNPVFSQSQTTQKQRQVIGNQRNARANEEDTNSFSGIRKQEKQSQLVNGAVDMENGIRRKHETKLDFRCGFSIALYESYLYIIGGSQVKQDCFKSNFVIIDVDPIPCYAEVAESVLQAIQVNSVYLKNLRAYFNNPLYSDIHFNVQGEVVYAHRIVVDSMSEMFNRLIGMDAKKVGDVYLVNIEGVDQKVFKCVLESYYSNQLILSEEYASDSRFLFEMFAFCNAACILSMLHSIINKIIQSISSQNVNEILKLSIDYRAHFVFLAVQWFMRRNRIAFESPLPPYQNQ